MPTSYSAPPAGADAAGPRPDLRGHRLATKALLARTDEVLSSKQAPALVAGFAAGLLIGIGLLLAGAPDLVAIAVGLAVNLAVGLWAPILLLAPADRRLLAVAVRVATYTSVVWRRAYGKAVMPRSEEQFLLWLAAQPATTGDPDALDIEASLYLSLGRNGEARERVERLPDNTPWWRFVQGLALAQIEFDSGGRGDLAAAREEAAKVRGERRTAAVASLALEDASQALVRGEDWDPPIARAVAGGRPPIVGFLIVGVAQLRRVLPRLVVSELALGAVVYLVAGGLGG